MYNKPNKLELDFICKSVSQCIYVMRLHWIQVKEKILEMKSRHWLPSCTHCTTFSVSVGRNSTLLEHSPSEITQVRIQSVHICTYILMPIEYTRSELFKQ